MNLSDLKAPFAPNKISWRIGSTNADKSKGMALAYIDARDVQDRLDAVCGIGGWQNRYIPMHDKKTVCEIGIKIGEAWIWKSDGAGDSDVEAEKGSLSDAFKRCAVKWGIGRYLYDVEPPWVTITPAGRSFKIADHEYKRLENLLSKDSKPEEQDITDGVKNWCDQQKEKIAACKTLPELMEWLDKNGGDLLKPALSSGLDRLLKKNRPAFDDLKTYYLQRLTKV